MWRGVTFQCCHITLIFLGLAVSGCSSPEEDLRPVGERLEAAQAAIDAGNNEEALKLLDELVESHPTGWSYSKRASLHLEMGNDAAARADCEAGLEVAPTHREMNWMLTELKKPAGKRFKGRFAKPPDKGEG